MDFFLNADQTAITDAVKILITRHAGSHRLRVLGGDEPTYDHDLDGYLSESGFLNLVEFGQSNRLDQALVAEALAYGLATTAFASEGLVRPSLAGFPNGPISIIKKGNGHIGRFLEACEVVVVLDESEVHLFKSSELDIVHVQSRLGWPVGEIKSTLDGGTHVDVDPVDVANWWRIAIAIELVGTMRLAMDITIAYVSQRLQFGKAIGSFQAVQHGIAEMAVAVEGSRWLSLEASEIGTTLAAETALTYAIQASSRVIRTTHQYTGALGFSEEYDLHLATMRLVALNIEAMSIARPAVALAKQTWNIT